MVVSIGGPRMAKDKPLLLVDGSSYLFRAFHALPNLTASDGFPTGAVYGVIAMLRKLKKDFDGSPVAVVFDAGGKSFRHEIYPAYKANRPPMMDELRQQIQPIHDIIKAMGMPLIVVDGVEADDVIGTLAEQATASKRRVVVSTSDKDMAQLVSDYVTLVNTMTETRVDRAGVAKKYGVPPELIVDYLALMGDSSDNIPGVPKVGPKTAAKWLAQFGSLARLVEHAEEVKGKVGESLRASLDQLPLSRTLATIKCDVELPVSLADLSSEDEDREALMGFYRRLGFKAWLEDLGGVVEEPLPVASRNFGCIDDFDKLVAWTERLREAGTFALSVETTRSHYMNAEIVGFAFAIEPDEAVYVPVGHDLAGAGGQLALADALTTLSPILEDSKLVKIGQNLKSDKNVLANYGVNLVGIGHDTMLESYVLNSVGTRRHNMDDLAEKHLNVRTVRYEDVAGKGAKQLDFSEVAVEEATQYAAGAAETALKLHRALWPKLEVTGRLSCVFSEIELPLLSVLSRIERAGTLVDADLLEEQSLELANRMATLEERAYQHSGQEFNLASPKQLQEILYDKLALPALSKTQTGQRSTAERVLQELALEYELPQIILDHRQLSKLKSTYTDSLPGEINQNTGRIHTSYQQAVAATGRLSSQRPNLQNIPIRTEEGRRIRRAFVAPQGSRIIAADYSQIELRIMAHLSQDAGLMGAFAAKLDVHRATASEVFSGHPEEITDDQRRAAKAINFGLIYGMSAFGLARQLGVTRNVAQEYIDRYFARYPGVLEYMNGIREQARAKGFVETMYGRRLYLPEINARQAPRRQAAERAAINAPMQGTAADIIKRAMIKVDNWIAVAGLGASMIMQVHDELVFEVREVDVDAVVEGVREQMMAAADLSIELVVDIGVGSNWEQAH
jgi:DNA polymerase-1